MSESAGRLLIDVNWSMIIHGFIFLADDIMP
jgi:hypothetical protein